jgi:hypothetical protein
MCREPDSFLPTLADGYDELYAKDLKIKMTEEK